MANMKENFEENQLYYYIISKSICNLVLKSIIIQIMSVANWQILSPLFNFQVIDQNEYLPTLSCYSFISKFTTFYLKSRRKVMSMVRVSQDLLSNLLSKSIIDKEDGKLSCLCGPIPFNNLVKEALTYLYWLQRQSATVCSCFRVEILQFTTILMWFCYELKICHHSPYFYFIIKFAPYHTHHHDKLIIRIMSTEIYSIIAVLSCI